MAQRGWFDRLFDRWLDPTFRQYRMLRIICAECDPWRREILIDQLITVAPLLDGACLPGNRVMVLMADALRTGPVTGALGPVEQLVAALSPKEHWDEEGIERYRESAWALLLAMDARRLSVAEIIAALQRHS